MTGTSTVSSASTVSSSGRLWEWMTSGANASTIAGSAAAGSLAQRIPGLEQLVAGAVELGQRPPAVGEAERDLAGEPDGVLHRPHAGLLLEEEDPHHLRDLIVFAGFPTTTA